jgi:hypothetical protein
VTLYFGISVFPSQYHHLKTTLIRQRKGQSLRMFKRSIFRCVLLLGDSSESEFRSRGITEKKEYNIHNKAKV